MERQGTPRRPAGGRLKPIGQESVRYLETNKVRMLLEDLISDLVINQPNDPRRWVHTKLGQILGVNSPHQNGEGHPGSEQEPDANESPKSDAEQGAAKKSRDYAIRLFAEVTGPAGSDSLHFTRRGLASKFDPKAFRAWEQEAGIQLRDLVTKLGGEPSTQQETATQTEEEAKPKPAAENPSRRSVTIETTVQTGTATTAADANTECSLRIIAVNDVYELHNFAHLDTIIKKFRTPNTITMLPGDFIAPSLLSSLDHGKGMIDVMNKVGIDYVCFGNHETDVPFDELQKRIAEYQGVWVNTNMPSFAIEPALPTHAIVDVKGGGQERRVGLLGLLTEDKNLYQKGAFGGAEIEPVVETALKFKALLDEKEKLDLIIPMTHQVVARDREMARSHPEFPLLMGAHDHDVYIEKVNGVDIVKTGADAVYAAIVDITWTDASTKEPEIEVTQLTCADYPPNPEIVDLVKQHMHVVEMIETARLCEAPKGVQLRSVGMRREPTTVGTMLTTALRDGLGCQGVMIDAGAIRANRIYPEETQFLTYGDLKQEIPFDTHVVVVPLSGQVVFDAVKASRAPSYLDPPVETGGFLQTDDGILWDKETNAVTHIGGEPIDLKAEYQIGVVLLSLHGMNKNQPLIDWSNEHPELVPPADAESGQPAKNVIVSHYSKVVWMQMGDLGEIDQDDDGRITVDEVRAAAAKVLGQDPPEMVIQNLMQAVDEDNDGSVSKEEFMRFMQFYRNMMAPKEAKENCTLRIIAVNDVYELDNFAHLDTVIKQYRTPNTITMLAGDFVAPSLLSSLDHGKGMIDVMNAVGIDYVCFGNHETDVPFDALLERIKEYKGVWINTNMPSFNIEPPLPEYAVVNVEGGGQSRKVGLLGLLTDDKNLYQAGAFGGAVIEPVVPTAVKYKALLEEKEGVDLVIPMTHQVIAQDRDMARSNPEFPLLMGGHDHDVYIEKVNGVDIVKTGADAVFAAVVDVTWPNSETSGGQPTITVEKIKCSDFHASHKIQALVKKHMHIVEVIEMARLVSIEPGMTSVGMRREPTSMGILLTTAVRDGLQVDGVMMDAGAIRGNRTYPEDQTFFTYGDLKKEIPFDTEVAVVPLTGEVVQAAIAWSRRLSLQDPPLETGGYLQTDDGITWDRETNTVTHIGKEPIDLARTYRMGVVYLSLNGMNRNQPLIDWSNANPDLVPPMEVPRPAKNIIIEHYARGTWSQLSKLATFDDLDVNQDGMLTAEEVKVGASRILGQEVPDMVVEDLMKAVDTDNSGTVSKEEFEKIIQYVIKTGQSLTNAFHKVSTPKRTKSHLGGFPTVPNTPS